MAHLAHEEECNISVMGRDYTIDLGTMQQVLVLLSRHADNILISLKMYIIRDLSPLLPPSSLFSLCLSLSSLLAPFLPPSNCPPLIALSKCPPLIVHSLILTHTDQRRHRYHSISQEKDSRQSKVNH